MSTASLDPQLAGLAHLTSIADEQARGTVTQLIPYIPITPVNPTVPMKRTSLDARTAALPEPAGTARDRGRHRRRVGDSSEARVEAGEDGTGAVALTASRSPLAHALVSAALLAGCAAWGARHLIAARAIAEGGGTALGELYALTFLALAWQVILYALDRPFRPGPAGQLALDLLNVTIAVPLFNEDPAIARASLLSMLKQTRLPNHVYVVDDGSSDPKANYTAVRREIAARAAAAGVRFTWVRTPNGGKRHAQAAAIRATPDADVYLTVDSDSRLDSRAVAELVAPFANPRVQSVAGIFLTANNRGPNQPPARDDDDTEDDGRRPSLLERAFARARPVVAVTSWRGSQLLSRVLDLIYLPSQLLVRGGMSVMGSVLVNSGAIAALRADAVREALPVYLDETFFGVPVSFSDDSMLTLLAFLKGKTVHQPTAFAFAIMPEVFSHHRRQYERWMRGSFIRSWWRFRYLPLRSYAFWWHLLGWVLSAVSGWAFTDVVVTTVLHSGFRWSYLLVPMIAGYALALPYLTVNRSDESFHSRLLTFALAPLAVLWAFTVLRVWRWYGAATCRRTGWGTRQTIEVTLNGENL